MSTLWCVTPTETSSTAGIVTFLRAFDQSHLRQLNVLYPLISPTMKQWQNLTLYTHALKMKTKKPSKIVGGTSSATQRKDRRKKNNPL